MFNMNPVKWHTGEKIKWKIYGKRFISINNKMTAFRAAISLDESVVENGIQNNNGKFMGKDLLALTTKMTALF